MGVGGGGRMRDSHMPCLIESRRPACAQCQHACASSRGPRPHRQPVRDVPSPAPKHTQDRGLPCLPAYLLACMCVTPLQHTSEDQAPEAQPPASGMLYSPPPTPKKTSRTSEDLAKAALPEHSLQHQCVAARQVPRRRPQLPSGSLKHLLLVLPAAARRARCVFQN